jgi:hypothetical protein
LTVSCVEHPSDDLAAAAALQRVVDDLLRAPTWMHATLPEIELRRQWRSILQEREALRGNQQQA